MNSTIAYQNLSQSKKDALFVLSQKLQIPVEWISNVIYLESRFNPSVINSIGATGLIQFLPDKGKITKLMNGKHYVVRDIAKLSFESQCILIYEYYKPFIGKIKSQLDAYICTFYPAVLGKSLDTKIGGLIVAQQNPLFNKLKDNQITISDVNDYLNSQFPNIKKKI